MANAYLAQEEHDKVVKTLNNAEGLAADKQKPMVYKLRGGALAIQKKWAEAIDDLERAVSPALNVPTVPSVEMSWRPTTTWTAPGCC